MEHQYPASITDDESMLAELMLPDQTHVRSQDWTIFFLHKDTSGEDGGGVPPKGKRKRENRGNYDNDGQDEDPGGFSDESSDEEDGDEGPPLMHVLNLVNTKQDNTARRYGPSLEGYLTSTDEYRGAVVKSMAICTRHSFLHIYKVST